MSAVTGIRAADHTARIQHAILFDALPHETLIRCVPRREAALETRLRMVR